MELIRFFSTLGELGQLYCGLGTCIVLPYALFILYLKLKYTESILEDFPIRLASSIALGIIFFASGTFFGSIVDELLQSKFPTFGVLGAVLGVLLGSIIGFRVGQRK